MIIIKSLTTAGADTGWPMYHVALANTEYLMLNTDAAKATAATMWNSTTPTSSVFSLGTHANVNTNGDSYVAYVFAAVEGFSSFGSVTGNASTDGPFIYCGFQPRLMILKDATVATNTWWASDSARDTYNEGIRAVEPNLSSAERTSTVMHDIVSNGYKIRTSNSAWNTTSSKLVYATFAALPLKYATAF